MSHNATIDELPDPQCGARSQHHVLMLADRYVDERRSSILAGRHPRLDYLELVDTYRMELFDYSVLDSMRLPRVFRRLIGRSWLTAVVSMRRHRANHTILAMGEDIGIPTALLHGVARRPGRRPTIAIVMHGSYFRSPKFRLVCVLLRRRRDIRFLCLSTAIRDQLVNTFRISPSRVDVVGYGVDTKFFAPSETSGQRGALVAAAGTANRDYQSLVEAARDVDVDVRIAADSAWFPAKVDIDGTDLPERVSCRSYGDYPGLRRLYDEATVVVVPLYEALHACGYAVILEAMAMARPVITTRVIGRNDFVRDGENGFYVEPGDVADLQARIIETIERPAFARELGLRARELTMERYSLEQYVDRLAAGVGLSRDDADVGHKRS